LLLCKDGDPVAIPPKKCGQHAAKSSSPAHRSVADSMRCHCTPSAGKPVNLPFLQGTRQQWMVVDDKAQAMNGECLAGWVSMLNLTQPTADRGKAKR
jgi:hypothetical protein